MTINMNSVYGKVCRRVKRLLPFCLFTFLPLNMAAQVGEYRTDLAIGVNGGYMLSSVGFTPEVPQKQLGGLTGGLSVRYTCEKYFKSICALVAEVNIAQTGWKEDILDRDNHPVPLHTDPTQSLRYERQMTYVQVPIMARMGWGRERRGLQGFIQLGPQMGFFLKDKVSTNFDVHQSAFNPESDVYQYGELRTSHVVAQDTMAVEKKFDYGVAAGAGIEFSLPRVGHFILEGRYYYGLGNIYGNSKSDVFGKSNFGQIVIKATYLFDIIRTKNSKIK